MLQVLILLMSFIIYSPRIACGTSRTYQQTNHQQMPPEPSDSLLSDSQLQSNQIQEPILPDQSPTQHDEEDKAFKLTGIQHLIDRVGGEGRYQFISFLVMASTWFLTAWLLVGIAFFFDDTITCRDSAYDTQQKCMKLVCDSPSSAWKYIIKKHPNSILFSFQPFLLCDNTSTILQSMVFVGSLIGFFVVPFIADNLGRKIALQISWAICTLGVLILALAHSITMVGAGYLLAGLGSNPAITLSFSFINQQCLYKSRQRYGVFVQIFLGLGESTIALLFIPEGNWGWRQVMIILLALVLLANGALFYLLETPKFLFRKNKTKALEVLNRIAKINRKRPLHMEDLEKIDFEKDLEEDSSSSVIDLFRYRSLRMITVATGFGFLGIQTIYYFISLNLKNAGFNIFVNQEIIGGSEIAGYLVAQLIISKIKRRPFSILGMGISSLMCLLLVLLTSLGDTTTLLLLETISLIINRLVVCCFWSIFFVYVAQLYPTKVRSLGYGWVSAVGMVGSTLCPYLIQLSESHGMNTWINPVVIGGVGTLFLFFLPETYGKKLEDEIEERRTETPDEDQEKF